LCTLASASWDLPRSFAACGVISKLDRVNHNLFQRGLFVDRLVPEETAHLGWTIGQPFKPIRMFPYADEKPARIRIEQVQAALDERVLLEDLVFRQGKPDAAVVDEGDVVGHLLQIGRDVGR